MIKQDVHGRYAVLLVTQSLIYQHATILLLHIYTIRNLQNTSCFVKIFIMSYKQLHLCDTGCLMATSIKFYILRCDTMLSLENIVTVQSNVSKYLPCYMSKHPRRQNFFSYFHYQLPNPVMDQNLSLK